MMSQRGKLPTSARGWMIERWQTMVGRNIGEQYAPDDEHGLSLRPSPLATYVSKLGCELTDPFGQKRGRRASRTPFEIAADWVEGRSARDANLWRTYANAIKGHRHLTWSRGLKRAHGIVERPDHDLASDEEPTTDDQLVAELRPKQWAMVRCTYIQVAQLSGPPRRESATAWLLEQIELGGAAALMRALAIIHKEHARQKAARERR